MTCWTKTVGVSTLLAVTLAIVLGTGLLTPGTALAQDAATEPAAETAAPIAAPDADHHDNDADHAGDAAHDGDSEDGHSGSTDATHSDNKGEHHVPGVLATAPFIIILLCIAILPLVHKTEHWWHKNQSKLLVSVVLATITLIYYFSRGYGIGHGEHATDPGIPTILGVLHHAVMAEYIPFIVLLFSLYTICGGIQLTGDLKATPLTNTIFLAIGASLASFIGTTGAAMLLIRPVLQTNKERRYVRHTVIFFIFLVANIGGSLLPIGDPPLFLGYLKGVPFLWTFNLWAEWVFTCGIILVVYFVWDTIVYKKEPPLDHLLDEMHIEPLRLNGAFNFLWLLGVVLSVALLVPEKPFLGKYFIVPNYMREGMQLVMVLLAWVTSKASIRKENHFDFFAIIEVAVLFIGIFICMQVPVEILNARGSELGLNGMPAFFWATGTLSSFLDNAPTYVVFFETARAMPMAEGVTMVMNSEGAPLIAKDLLIAISLGSVFMGAMSYIGNGPNFMVKSIAEQSDVRMPSFFGYMVYSCFVLIPVFILMNVVFFYLLH